MSAADRIKLSLLKKDVEHEAGQVVALAERIEGNRNADTTTVNVFNEAVDTLKAVRGLLMQYAMGALAQAGGSAGMGFIEDDDAPF